MGQDVITCSAVCSFASHLQAAVETIPHLCVSERNKPTPVRRRLSLTHAGLGTLNPGGIGLTSSINVVDCTQLLSLLFVLVYFFF